MSKPKASTQSTPAPSAPKPQNELFYENDFLRSSRMYDKGQNAYISKSFSNPTEQGIENQATDYLGKLVGQIPDAVNLSPEKIKEYSDAYSAPQIQALNDSYNQATGQADQAASSRGLSNSVGFADYKANQIEKNRAQGLADIASNTKMMEYDLPNKILSPYVNQFNLYNAALSGQQASMSQDLEPAFQGSQAANNALSQNYQNQLQAWQAAQNQNQGRGGLFSFFTGGY